MRWNIIGEELSLSKGGFYVTSAAGEFDVVAAAAAAATEIASLLQTADFCYEFSFNLLCSMRIQK